MADKMMRMAGRGIDGTAKPIKTTNDGEVLAKEYRKLGDYAFSTGSEVLQVEVIPGETKVIYTLDQAVKIDNFIWVTDNLDLRISIKKKLRGGGNIVVGDLYISGDNAPLSPRNIRDQAISMFEINAFDVTGYKFRLRDVLDCPDGITIEATYPTGYSGTAKISLRASGVIYI